MGLIDLFRRRPNQAPATSFSASTAMLPPSLPAPAVPDTGFAVIDFETARLLPKINRIVHVAVVVTDPEGVVQSRWSTLVNPDGPMEATHIHGITDSDVRGAPKFKDMADELRERLEGLALAAHNMRFDSSLLQAEYLRLGWDVPKVLASCT